MIFPWPPVELSPNARIHWAAKSRATKKYRTTCGWIAKEANIKAPEGQIHIKLTFCPPDNRKRDRDNMISSIKALFDGLADALGVNDRQFRPTYEYSTDRTGKVIVEIVA